MQKKKILYIITKSNWGGAQRYVYDLATHISKEDFEKKVIVGGRGDLTSELSKLHIQTISLKSLTRDVHILKDILVFFELIILFNQEQPDIIHLNSSKIGALGGLAGRINNIFRFFSPSKNGYAKIIFTAHGWAHTETHRPLWQRYFIAFFHWLTITLSHKTIAVSSGSKDEVRHFPFVYNKIEIIHNGITPPLFLDKQHARQAISIIAKDPQLLNSTIWIGTIAELHKNKGLSYLIKSFAALHQSTTNQSLRNTRLIIIGDGEEKETLEKLARSLYINQYVYILTKEHSANTLLKSFDIFVLPSIKEGLPYALLEAGSAGLPTIASKVGGIPEVIHHDKNGFLTEPGSAQSLTVAMKKLLLNPGVMEELGNTLKFKIEKDFSLKQMVQKTTLLYSKE